MLRFGGIDGGECEAPVKFPYPADVDNLKARIDPYVRSLDATVRSCPGLAPEELAAWNGYLAGWNAFFAQKTPLFGSYGQWVTACTWSHTFDAWREKLEKTSCKVVGPDKTKGIDTKALDALGGIAKAAAVVGGVVLLLVYAPEIKMGVGRLVKR